MASLAFTKVTFASASEFMKDKLRYTIMETEAVATYTTYVADGTVAEETKTAVSGKTAGRAMTVHIPMSFVADWPQSTTAFVTKWSGACLRDVTSTQGGFCILETNDTDLDS